MVVHALLLLLTMFQRKDVIVSLTLVVQIVTLTCVQASSVAVEYVSVETVNVIQIMSTSTTLVNRHVHHHRVRPRLDFNDFDWRLFFGS